MPRKPTQAILWAPDVEENDYPAAESYLNLVYPASDAEKLVKRLRTAKLTKFKSKDIFRASQLSLLGVSNFHVERFRSKIKEGVALDPLLLVRNERQGRVVVADGYHRLCAVYGFDEDAWIPCKIV